MAGDFLFSMISMGICCAPVIIFGAIVIFSLWYIPRATFRGARMLWDQSGERKMDDVREKISRAYDRK